MGRQCRYYTQEGFNDPGKGTRVPLDLVMFFFSPWGIRRYCLDLVLPRPRRSFQCLQRSISGVLWIKTIPLSLEGYFAIGYFTHSDRARSDRWKAAESTRWIVFSTRSLKKKKKIAGLKNATRPMKYLQQSGSRLRGRSPKLSRWNRLSGWVPTVHKANR